MITCGVRRPHGEWSEEHLHRPHGGVFSTVPQSFRLPSLSLCTPSRRGLVVLLLLRVFNFLIKKIKCIFLSMIYGCCKKKRYDLCLLKEILNIKINILI